MTLKILVADDHKYISMGLFSLIGRETDVEIIGRALDGESAIRMAREMKPDIIIMDVGMPGVDGITATKKIMSEMPDTKIVGLSVHTDPETVKKMIDAGAKGYVFKDRLFDELMPAIRAAIRGNQYMPVAEEC